MSSLSAAIALQIGAEKEVTSRASFPARPGRAMRGSKEVSLGVSAEDRELMYEFLRSPETPGKIALRLSIVLGGAVGISDSQLMRDLETTGNSIRKWRVRYQDDGLEGILTDAPRSGRKKKNANEIIIPIGRHKFHAKPSNAQSPTIRAMADALGLSSAPVYHIRKQHHLSPCTGLCTSTDNRTQDHVREACTYDVVGLYIDGRGKSLVMSVNEGGETSPRLRAQKPDRLVETPHGSPSGQHGLVTLGATVRLVTRNIYASCDHRPGDFQQFRLHIRRIMTRYRAVYVLVESCAANAQSTLAAWTNGGNQDPLHLVEERGNWLSSCDAVLADKLNATQGNTRGRIDELKGFMVWYLRAIYSSRKPFYWISEPE